MGLVALGSAVGGVTRWGLSLGAVRLLGPNFPFVGTLFINVTGCCFLGWLYTLLSERLLPGAWLGPPELRLLLGVGFAGGYTTFSTFGWETNTLLREGDSLVALLYAGASIFLGLLAVRLGARLALL
jgi:CrcB protein